jgi:hypothetical protein
VVRKRVVDEILSTEASYVRSLEIVVKVLLALFVCLVCWGPHTLNSFNYYSKW